MGSPRGADPLARLKGANHMRFYDESARAIRAARDASGLSRQVLAAQIGVTTSMLQSIENGSVPCSLYVAARIAEALDITIDALAPVLIDEKDAAE